MGKFLYIAVQSCSESWVSIQRIESILLMEVSGIVSKHGRARLRCKRQVVGGEHVGSAVQPWMGMQNRREKKAVRTRGHHLMYTWNR